MRIQNLPSSPPKKPTTGMTLPPNNRHHWDEDRAKWVRRVRDVAMPLMYRMKDIGFENIPKEGTFIVGPTHQSMFDAPLASRIPDTRPFGSMSDVNQFRGVLGRMLAEFGSFPVDRYKEYEGDFPKPAEHAKEILNEGKNFIFYPEGRIYDTDLVQPLQSGVGRISVGSSVKYALPVAQHYAKDTESHPVETALGVGLSAAAAGAGIWAACGGGLGAGIAGALTGLVGGALVGGTAGFLTGPKDNEAVRTLGAAKWAGIAALATGVGAAAVGALAPGLAPAVVGTTSVLTGLAGLGMTHHWTHRPVAYTSVAQPIEVEPYRQRAAASDDPNAAQNEANRLTADFHRSMTEVKDALTGKQTPYKMDYQGRSWGQQADGRWALLHQQGKREWVPVEPMVFEEAGNPGPG